MQKLIKDGQIIDDSTVVLDSDFEGALPGGAVLVPLSFFKENKALLESRSDVGVWLDSHEEPEELVDDLEKLPIIAINFPKFGDGRGYSYARLLRDRFNYQGEIRAIGDVLQDQLFYMQRCGFNAFAVRADRDITSALTALTTFSSSYQAACDKPDPLFRRRS